MSEAKQRCCKRVYTGSFEGHQCTKPALVEAKGKWYCAVHDPAKVKERRDNNLAKWELEHEKRLKVLRLQSAAPDLLAALETVQKITKDLKIGLNMLSSVVDEVIKKTKGEM